MIKRICRWVLRDELGARERSRKMHKDTADVYSRSLDVLRRAISAEGYYVDGWGRNITLVRITPELDAMAAQFEGPPKLSPDEARLRKCGLKAMA
jgi:hypothetical protein